MYCPTNPLDVARHLVLTVALGKIAQLKHPCHCQRAPVAVPQSAVFSMDLHANLENEEALLEIKFILSICQNTRIRLHIQGAMNDVIGGNVIGCDWTSILRDEGMADIGGVSKCSCLGWRHEDQVERSSVGNDGKEAFMVHDEDGVRGSDGGV